MVVATQRHTTDLAELVELAVGLGVVHEDAQALQALAVLLLVGRDTKPRGGKFIC
jgi:hypothetical protein